ncbi:MAG: hypothetical protein EPO68_04250 [Planctomycetota bacterium]|nr:MAG: hypothetical protein EPO68_04250 [Planctomycetota bacterium]
MLFASATLFVCAAGDPSLAAYVQSNFTSVELAKLEPAALLQRAYDDGVLASPDAKAPGALHLLELRDRAAGAGAGALHSGNPYAAPLFAALPPLEPAADGSAVEREPNDTRAWADPIGCGVVDGALGFSDDSDCLRLEIAAPTLLRAVTSAGAAPAATDTLLELTDGRGGFLYFDDDSGPGLYSQMIVPLLPGQYQLRVLGFLGQTGGWRLTTTCTPLSVAAFVPGVVTNGSVGAAQPLRAFTMDLAADMRLTLRCNGVAGFDPILLLRNASGASMVFNDDANGLNSEIRAHLPAGQYQLWVQGFNGTAGSFTLSTTEALALALPDGCANPAGTLTSTHQWDFQRWTLSDPIAARLALAPQSVPGGTNDTVLDLYDATLHRVSLVDDAPPSFFGAFAIPLPPGTYYTSVSAFDGTGTILGAYATQSECTTPVGTSILPCNASVATALSSPGSGVLAKAMVETDLPVEVRAQNDAYGGLGLDSVLTLLDVNGVMLDQNDDIDASFGSAAGTLLAPGICNALLTGYAGAAVGSSDLRTVCALQVLGTPSIGAEVFHASRAKAGDRVLGLGAVAAIASGLAFPPLQGVCLLDPTLVSVIGYYQMGTFGEKLVGLRVPPAPGLIGTEYAMQNVVLDIGQAGGWFSNHVVLQIQP